MAIDDSGVTQVFRNWLSDRGDSIGFHPNVCYSSDSAGGHTIRATSPLPADTVVVTIPFSCAITPALARKALESVCNKPDELGDLTERQLVCIYICAHWALGLAPLQKSSQISSLELSTISAFVHGSYISTLPQAADLLTPLHWSQSELELTKGTNLYRATLDRRTAWESELSSARNILTSASLHPTILNSLTWPAYLTASTHISSRAFPSTLLSRSPSLISTPSSHPVLLPGIDACNHARGARVSWSVSHLPSPGASRSSGASDDEENLTISLITHDAIPAGAEVYNNYGPKPNAELVLGYGFALPSNPDDTIVLRVGGAGAQPTSSTASDTTNSVKMSNERHEIGRGARGAEAVYGEVRRTMRSARGLDAETDEEELDAWEYDLDAAECLADMVMSVLDALPADTSLTAEDIRPEVTSTMRFYVDGQRGILRDLAAFTEEKRKAAYARAEAAGVTVVDQDEDVEPDFEDDRVK